LVHELALGIEVEVILELAGEEELVLGLHLSLHEVGEVLHLAVE
jgi:hypothetical protein